MPWRFRQPMASMMTAKVKGKNCDDASSTLRAFENLIVGDGNDVPQTLGDLATVPGVGPTKLDRYGADVLSVLNR